MRKTKSAKGGSASGGKEKQIAIFEGKKIRRLWDEHRERWYFSVIDIISILTEQVDFKKAQSYWTTLKSRLKQEGNESVTKCDKLKLQSSDGKYYKTDAAKRRLCGEKGQT